MTDDIILCIETMNESMQNAIQYFEKEFEKSEPVKPMLKCLMVLK